MDRPDTLRIGSQNVGIDDVFIGGADMHIAITGVTGVWNRGVDALVDTTVREIRRRWRDATISVLTSDVEYDLAYLPDGVTGISDVKGPPKLQNSIKPAIRRLLGAKPSGSNGNARAALQALKEADMVIALGGDIFSSDYGSASLRRHVATLEAAQTRGARTAILAHSIGPFATEEDAATMRGVLQRSDLVTVRESFTQEYLTSSFEIGPERAVLTADLAFLLEPSGPERAAAILAGLGLEEGKFVAMAASQGITNFSSVQEEAVHDAAWLEAIETVLGSTSHSVLLIPHVQSPRIRNDDAQIAFRLLERVNFNPRVRVAFGSYGARDYKALIARSRFLIGERMHACIAALSSCTPTITIGYSVKARGIVHDIFGDKAEEYQLITPVSQFVEPGQITTMIGTVEGNIESIRADIAAKIGTIRTRANDNFTRLQTLVGSLKS